MVSIWKIAPGANADAWEDCHARGYISINWLNEIDFTTFPTREELRTTLHATYLKEGRGGTPSIWDFTYAVRAGHIIVANDGRSCVKGVGVVTSGYLPPEHRLNPNKSEHDHRHVHLVDWLVTSAVQLGRMLFQPRTVYQLEPRDWEHIVKCYRRKSVRFEPTLRRLVEDARTIERAGPTEGTGAGSPGGDYSPPDGDERERVIGSILARRGQSPFRNQLLSEYRGECQATGSRTIAVLEAAHIDPYRGLANHHPSNGLLLRADIHTLFDLDLLGIEPESLNLRLHPGIQEEYCGQLRKRLACKGHLRPSTGALQRRFSQFKERLKRPL